MDIAKLEKIKNNSKDIRYIIKKIIPVLHCNNNIILDIGCGWGFWTEKFKSKLNIGVDIRNIFDKKKISSNLRFVLADAYDLPFREESFGCIILFDTIEHFQDDFKALKEIARVLKKNGLLILTTPNKDRLANRIKRLIGKPINYPFSLGVDHYNIYDNQEHFHFREYSDKEIIALLKRVGFVNINIEGIGIGMGRFLICTKFPLLEKFSKTWLILARKT